MADVVDNRKIQLSAGCLVILYDALRRGTQAVNHLQLVDKTQDRSHE